MIYSLSEIDAQCKKAARGAGLSWGYAEEAGKVARWLAAHRLPGVELLAEYLTRRLQSPETYQGADSLCPLLGGAGLCDAGYDDKESSLVVGQFVYPILLLPYLVQLSCAAGKGLHIQWPGTDIVYHNELLYLKDRTSIAVSAMTTVSCDWFEPDLSTPLNPKGIQQKCVTGQFINPNDWIVLEKLAHLTYVPATEASRRGAGPS